MPTTHLTADPFPGILLLLAFLWLAAKIGGEFALRLKLPVVAGELAAGIIITGLHHQFPALPNVVASPAAGLLGDLGIIVLMFAVGLESTVPQMMRVGLPSLRVAVVGVILPIIAGLAGAWLLLPPGTHIGVDLFIGACLCATSIGISAQVLREKGAAKSPEGKVIIGAAVIDDVLGLLVLVAVSGVVAVSGTRTGIAWGPLGKTLGLAVGFLLLALTLGRRMTPALFKMTNRFRSDQVLLPASLGFAFFMGWLGNLAGLAPIVGAYAAGLILEPANIRVLEERELHTLGELMQPLVVTFSPLFFVLMGAQVDPRALLQGRTLLLALSLAALGTAGKFIAGYVAGNKFRSAVVGWGMVSRGEVGLIFVATGATLTLAGQPLLTPQVQAGIIGALMLTTMIGPVGLGRVLNRIPN